MARIVSSEGQIRASKELAPECHQIPLASSSGGEGAELAVAGTELCGELLEPHAHELAEALRAFGYDLPTALADLIDNSIAADARTVRVEYSSDPGEAWVAVVDDGRGMNDAELRDAMRFARDPSDDRATGDLGRFGLGMKTASLSQARKVTVLSRVVGGSLIGMTWDLEHVRQQKKWRVITELDTEALGIVQLLGFDHQGTMVLWRHTDKLGSGQEMQHRITATGKQLALLFHRYMASGRLSLRVGQHALSPMDPYLLRNALTQDRGVEELEHDGYRITVNPVVLPHPSRLTRQESLLASGPGGLLARQGFYVYRGQRLIVAGGWLGLAGMHNAAPTRLARIAVEVPPGADLAWRVDVRKSTVRPPKELAVRLTELAEDVRARSERVFTHRGTPAPKTSGRAPTRVVWSRVRRLGRYEYIINREHPLVAEALASQLAGPIVDGILRLVETTLPGDLISGEPAAASLPADNEANSGAETEEILSVFREMLAAMPADPGRRAVLAEELADAEPFIKRPGIIRDLIDADMTEEQ